MFRDLDKALQPYYITGMEKKIPTLTQCFSAIIASGNGQRCNDFRNRIRQQFLYTDEETGQYKSIVFKYGMDQYPEAHKRMRYEMGTIVSSMIGETDLSFFGSDLGEEDVQSKQ